LPTGDTSSSWIMARSWDTIGLFAGRSDRPSARSHDSCACRETWARSRRATWYFPFRADLIGNLPALRIDVALKWLMSPSRRIAADSPLKLLLIRIRKVKKSSAKSQLPRVTIPDRSRHGNGI
jgi:hypothetical protein